MSTKFIFDREKKKQEETIEEIFKIVQKEPYPDKNTTVLANFVEAMFQVNQARREKLKEKNKEAGELAEHKEKKPARKPLPKPPAPKKKLPIPPKKEEPLLPPPPKGTKEELKPESYNVTTFNTQIGVKVEKDEAGKPAYNLNEPKIKPEVLKRVKDYVKSDFEKDFKVLDDQEYLKKKIEKACKKEDVECNQEYINNITYYLKRDLLGFRKIDPVMYDNHVKEIMCEGLNKPVTVDFKGIGKIKSNIIFTETKDLNVLLARLAKATGNVLSEETPILDSSFQGYRVQAILGMGGASSKLVIKKEMVT